MKALQTYGRTDGWTDRRTDGRTDTPSYRDARTHLKREEGIRKRKKPHWKPDRGQREDIEAKKKKRKNERRFIVEEREKGKRALRRGRSLIENQTNYRGERKEETMKRRGKCQIHMFCQLSVTLLYFNLWAAEVSLFNKIFWIANRK